MASLYDGSVRGRIVTPGGVLPDGLVTWTDGIIDYVGPADAAPDGVRAGGGAPAADGPSESGARRSPLVLPGLADVHNHGAVGHGFPGADAPGCAAAARYHRSRGTTTLLASTVSAPPSALAKQVAVLADVADEGLIDGIHLEGPFINACRCGAQDPRAIVPGDPDALIAVIAAGRGHVRSITLAPEVERLDELLDVCANYALVVSYGHTDAGYDATAAAIGAAASRGLAVTATHLFNAMPPVHHREPGAAGAMLAAAARGEAHVELIADGVHLSDAMVDLVIDTVGVDAITLVSDAMAAAGMHDGDYVLGSLPVIVDGGVARLKTDDGSQGAIAGGTSTIFDQVARMHARGVGLTDIALMAAGTGARVAGLAGRGAIAVGKQADLLLCDDADPHLTLRTVIAGGAPQDDAPDAGTRDAGTRDAGTRDAGTRDASDPDTESRKES